MLRLEATSGGAHLMIVEPEAGRSRALWTSSAARSGNRLAASCGSTRLRPRSARSARYFPEEGRIERVPESWPWEDSPTGVWASDGAACAVVDRRGASPVLRLADSGASRPRLARTSAGVLCLLGWSDEHELLAYVAQDGTLHFSCRASSSGGYERLMKAYPPTPVGVPPGNPVQSVRDGMGLDTTRSTIKIGAPEAMFFAWGTTPDGPCLFYTDTKDNVQNVWKLSFNRVSLVISGLDLKKDYRTQLLEAMAKENAESIGRALLSYARAHEGRLPSAASGAALEESLKPDLDYLGRMRATLRAAGAGAAPSHPWADAEGLASPTRRNPGEYHYGGRIRCRCELRSPSRWRNLTTAQRPSHP